MRIRSWPILLAAGCAVPEPDNPFHTDKRPVAVLETRVDGVPAFDGTRASAFVFDASGSTLPDGNGSIRWDLDGDGTFEDDSGDFEKTRFFTIAPAELPSGVGEVLRTVGVEVRWRQFRDEAYSTVRVSNARPAADAGAELAVPAFTGASIWLDACGGRGPGYGCSTTDPDGDPLEITWTQVRGDAAAVVATVGTGGQLRTAPLDPQLLTFRLEVDDGLASHATLLDVRVGGVLWAHSRELVERVRPEHDVSDFSDSYEAWAVDPATGSFWISERSGGGSFVRRWGSDLPHDIDAGPILATVSETWPLTPEGVVSVAPLGGDLGCAARDNTSTAPVTGDDFLWLPPGGTELVFDAPAGETPTRVFAMAGGDACFALMEDATPRLAIRRLDAGGLGTSNLYAAVTVPLEIVQAADGALWLRFADELVRVDDAGVTTAVPLLPTEDIRGIAAHPDADLWLYDRAMQRLVRLDGTTRTPFGPALVLAEIAGGGMLLTDLVRGDVFVMDRYVNGLRRLAWVEGDLVDAGQMSCVDVYTGALDNNPDVPLCREGGVWDARNGRVVTTLQLGADDRRIVAIPSALERSSLVAVAPSTIQPAIETTRGDLWVVDEYLDGVVRLDVEGRALARASVPGTVKAIARRDEGGFYAAYDDAGGASWLGAFDPAGAPVAGFTPAALPSSPAGLSASSAAGTLCLAAATPMRLTLGQSGATVEELDLATLSTPKDAAVAPDGACWFLDLGTGGAACPVTGPELLRFAAASTTPVGGTITNGITATCPRGLAVNAFDGAAWVVNDDTGSRRTFRMSTAGTVTTATVDGTQTPKGFALQRTCDADLAGCVYGWLGAQLNDGTYIVVGDEPGTFGSVQREKIPVPSSPWFFRALPDR